jgi:serine/threonine-protein kinase
MRPPAGPPEPAAVGPYRLEAALARGPLGATYRARDAHGVVVALKVLDLGATPDAPHRFEREAAIVARLSHPAIAAGLGHGRDGALGWIATAYVASGDLRRRLAAGPETLAPGAILALGARLAEALEHAHRAGVVHRDVKPGNVLVDLDADRVQLVDFGVAALHDALRTRTGALAGTPAYMAPELLAGAAPDAAADVYALAATLYEWIAGRPPHRAATLGELLRQVAQVPVSPPSHWRPGVPAACNAVLIGALAREPARRPRTAAAFAAALRRVSATLEAGN